VPRRRQPRRRLGAWRFCGAHDRSRAAAPPLDDARARGAGIEGHVMIFRELEVPGVFAIDPERLAVERGFFAPTFCEKELAARGLAARIAQCSIAWNAKKGTLRGMHYQAAPHEETKIVRCTRGAAHDVLVDLRPGSPTFRRWVAVELSEETRR